MNCALTVSKPNLPYKFQKYIQKKIVIGGGRLAYKPSFHIFNKIEAYDRVQFKTNRRGETVDWSSKQTNNGNCCEATTKPPTKCVPSKRPM